METKIPDFCSHYIGCGAVVIKDDVIYLNTNTIYIKKLLINFYCIIIYILFLYIYFLESFISLRKNW